MLKYPFGVVGFFWGGGVLLSCPLMELAAKPNINYDKNNYF